MANPTRREEKRVTILSAALDLFAERGFHATNVPQIAERAGVSVGTLYHYFENKEAVVNELYRGLREQMERAVWGDFPRGAQPYDQVRYFFSRSAEYALANPKAFAFLQLHHHAPYLDEASRALVTGQFEPEASMYEQARRAGVLKPLPDEVLSAFISGSLTALVRSAWQGRITLNPALIDQAAICCWQAITKGRLIMDQIEFTGEWGFVRLQIEGGTTNSQDGSVRAGLTVQSRSFRAEGKVWLKGADLMALHEGLGQCYKSLEGSYTFAPEAGTLTLTFSFERRTGKVTLSGSYQEANIEGNQLAFSIPTDQSYIGNAMPDIAHLAQKYGGTR